jgi:hypothetical protein
MFFLARFFILGFRACSVVCALFFFLELSLAIVTLSLLVLRSLMLTLWISVSHHLLH